MVDMFFGFLWADSQSVPRRILYDAASPPKAHNCIDDFNVVNGFALACGRFYERFMINAPPLFGYHLLRCCFYFRDFAALPVVLDHARTAQECGTWNYVSSLDLFFGMITALHRGRPQ